MISNKHLLLYAILITGVIGFILLWEYMVKHTAGVVETLIKAPCKHTNPRESYASAVALINSTNSLQDIDELVKRTVESRSCYLPPQSQTGSKFIMILPYRERRMDLLAFLLHVIPYARRAKLNMEILVAEQTAGKAFNRAKLFNAAVKEIDRASKAGKKSRLAGVNCFAFHDVDKLPENPDVPYKCLSGPHQLLRACNYRNGTLGTYQTFLGGVTMFTREQLEKINGASNEFYGWGGEDDDLWNRVKAANMTVIQNTVILGQFYEEHGDHERNYNPERFNILRRPNISSLMYIDGLQQTQYTLQIRIDYSSFVWMLFSV